MFKRKTQTPAETEVRVATKLKYCPSGFCVETPTGRFYVKQGKRFRVPTDRIFYTWGFPNVVVATDAAIKHLPLVGKLGLRDGWFVQEYATGKRYLVDGGKLRELKSPDIELELQLPVPYVVGEADLLYNERGEDIK
jgi:hypothetical protein